MPSQWTNCLPVEEVPQFILTVSGNVSQTDLLSALADRILPRMPLEDWPSILDFDFSLNKQGSHALLEGARELVLPALPPTLCCLFGRRLLQICGMTSVSSVPS